MFKLKRIGAALAICLLMTTTALAVPAQEVPNGTAGAAPESNEHGVVYGDEAQEPKSQALNWIIAAAGLSLFVIVPCAIGARHTKPPERPDDSKIGPGCNKEEEV